MLFNGFISFSEKEFPCINSWVISKYTKGEDINFTPNTEKYYRHQNTVYKAVRIPTIRTEPTANEVDTRNMRGSMTMVRGCVRLRGSRRLMITINTMRNTNTIDIRSRNG